MMRMQSAIAHHIYQLLTWCGDPTGCCDAAGGNVGVGGAGVAGCGFGVTTTVMFLLGPIVRPECCLSIVIRVLLFNFDTDLTLLKVALLLLLMLLF